MGNMMARVLSVLIFWAATQQGRGNEITERGLSLLGYHLCNYSLTKNVFKMVAYQKSYEKNISCGGWIPWMVCPRMYYKTQYHTVEVPETINLTDCCEGYEQVGLYCSLALNRSSVFASRPGICPMENMETSDYSCTFDAECPGLKKCCNSSKGAGCVDPKPEERMFWYNVTVLVKMDFNELIRVDSQLLNHSRLLHSMITGALRPLNASVHHIQSNYAEIYAGTVASQVLIGLHQPAPLAVVSSSLKNMVKRVYEVIDADVKDVDECSYAEFNACPEQNTCVNLEGYYSCSPEHQEAYASPHQLSTRKDGMAASTPSSELDPINANSSSPSISNSSLLSMTNQSTDAGCYPSAIINHRIFGVTSNSFEMSWHVTSTLNHTFQVLVFKDKEIVKNLKTEEVKMDVSGLEAGVMYSIEISYESCGKSILSHQNVKTEAKIFGVTMRILNYNFTEDLHDASSSAYEEFSRLLLTEIRNSFPPNISALYESGKLKVQIESLQAGSIIVRLRIAVQDPEFPVNASTFAPMLSYLYNGSVLLVDQQNSTVEDWDECASRTDNDCSVFAHCINLMGSYLCRCKTTMDTNPSRPGRNCEGEIVSLLTERTALEVASSTQLAPEASPAASAFPTITADPEMSTTTHHPAVLLLSERQALPYHSPTNAPPASWNKSLTPHMAMDNSPTAVTAEQQTTMSSSQQSSLAESSPGTLQQVAILTNASMGADKQEQHSFLLPVLSNETAFGISGSHAAFGEPQAHSQDVPITALPATGDAGAPTLSATLNSHTQTRRENSSWGQNHTAALGAPALPGFSLAPNPTLSPAMNHTVQKLNGVVRITNVKYTPGFSNASSEEYQNFAQLFVDEVHKSLPLDVLQQVDSGLIKVLITDITNGSTVVSFHLLIAEDVDIYYIITAFRDAIEHSSYFTVDKNSLSINALPPSQEGTVVDRKPLPSAVLPVTSLETSTYVSSFVSLNSSTTQNKALEDSPFSSVTLPLLTMGSVSAPDVPPRASPAPLVKPAQEASIKDAAIVFCEIEKTVIAIQKGFLHQESIPESSLYLGEPLCNVSISNDTHAVLQAGWSECGTEVETNVTNTIVKTILRNDDSAQGVIHHLKVASPIHCVFQNDLLTSSGYTAEGIYTIFEDLHGSGHFRTEMQLFIGNSSIPKNFSVSASDDVLIEVGIQRADSKLKVVLTDCWATPTNNSVDPLSFAFINNSCPIPNTYTTLLENGNSSKAQFKLKIFSFINNSVVYLHCKIRICMETPGSTCRTRCHAARSLKTGEIIATHRTSWGPLCKSAASNSKREKKPGVGVGYIILIAIAVFGFVLAVVSLVIFQCKRKMGRYNFRIKSDNFSYQVFYD
ncbi:uromodulin-like 1 isoform X2 [Numida meleagris]|uniref:uromodulin-like 1 isoform X2 n=1 Tax=Numida meleagris TaxID=8996 RepID=UPI000B3E14F3|nr:uromodulin-like 1 isoform X2 [Numida meleagris]